MKAWYFAPKSNRLKYGDNRLIRVGITHEVMEKPRLCEIGLHGSERVIDALKYSNHHILYRVELAGLMDIGDDKIAAQYRTYLKRYDLKNILPEFARWCALQRIELIRPYTDQYDLTVEFLETGRKSLRDAARVAALDAARVAARDADAARVAAEAAAEAAAWAAATATVTAKAAAAAASWAAVWVAAQDAQNTKLLEMIGAE